jgi:hypothetical protein
MKPMKNIIALTSVALFALFAVSCNTKDSTATSTETPTETAAAETTAAVPYPLDVCVVSGEELGSMGEPVVIVHEGRQIKFCCAECLPSFNKDPEKYLSKLSQ